jgi:hypothetical protein
VEAAASLAENLLKGAQGLNILATIDGYASLSSDSSKRANARPTNNWTAGNASASTAVNLREMSGLSGARRCTHAPSGTRELATVRHLPQPGWHCTHDSGIEQSALAQLRHVGQFFKCSLARRDPRECGQGLTTQLELENKAIHRKAGARGWVETAIYCAPSVQAVA